MALSGFLRRGTTLALAAVAVAALAPASLAADQAANDYRFSAPYSHGNLTIFMIHGKPAISGKSPLTLQEAMQRGLVRVIETGSVNQLEVENLGNEAVFIQSGDIVKGGKQDRVLSVDLILPPRSGKVAIASFCVEQNRWTQRGKEDVSTFGSAGALLPSRDMKIAARAPLMAPAEPTPGTPSGGRHPQQVAGGSVGNSQAKVWRGVSDMQEKLQRSVGAPVAAPQSASSLQLSMESEKLKQATEAYVATLKAAIDKEPGAIGFVFAINGQINSADVYGSPDLFRKMWPKLLQATAIEATAERKDGAPAQAPSTESLRDFFANAEAGKRADRKLTDATTIETRDADKAQLLEARQKGGGFVHRSYVSK
ncbi:MAG TPA: DUF6569 family protein [Vineibacter sp.]|nr:DUF6569 family protein [Vineibacter sp.]